MKTTECYKEIFSLYFLVRNKIVFCTSLKNKKLNSQIVNFAGDIKYEWNPFDIYEVIKFINWRPGFTIGNKTIDSLCLYLRAYQDALATTDLLDYGIPAFFHFSTWMCGISNNRALAAGWDYHILRKARRSQQKAYNLFFQFIEEYKTSITLAEEVVLTQENKETAKSSGIIRTSIYPVDDELDISEKSVHRIIVFRIGKSDSRWTAFLNGRNRLINSSFTDKASEAYNDIKREFNISKKQLRQLSSNQSVDMYKMCYKSKYYGPALSITKTKI